MNRKRASARVGSSAGSEYVCERDATHHRDGVDEWDTRNLALADADHVGRGIGCRLEERVHGLHALESGHDTVVGAWAAATLGMSKASNAGIEAKTIGEDLLDGICANGVEVLVVRALGDNDDCTTLANFTMLQVRAREST